MNMASYSGLFDGVHGAPYTLLVNRSTQVRHAGRVLKRRGMTRPREAVDTIVAGSSINGAAAVTYKQVAGTVDPGNAAAGGGAVTIETVTKIAAAQTTSASDATTADKMSAFSNRPSTYPTDASGNGGGGKLS